MIKVLFFIPNLGGGGAEKVLVNLVNNMNKEKFNITILTIFDDGQNKIFLDSSINYKYIFKKTFRGNIHLFKLFSPTLLYKFFIKEKYDILISYLQGPTTRIISGSKDSSITKINWVHTDLNRKKLLKSYRNYKEFIKSYNTYDCTIFVSETAKETFEKITGLHKNHYVRYNTIDTDQIKSNSLIINKDFTVDNQKINMMTVGRLIDVKGYDRLLRIVKKIKKDYQNFHLYILGEGSLRSDMEAYIEKNNLSQYVTLLGYKENPYQYLKKADLFVGSSYKEGFSTSITESLVLGVPVITTLCSGMEELLGKNNEYGIIVDNDEHSLYKGILSLITNIDKLNYYQKKAEQRGKVFDKKHTVTEVENLLYSIYNKDK